MKNKINSNEVVVSYKSLGDFVRQRRKSLGYSSIDSFAVANGIDRTYIVRLENGNQFGSPENFVAVAKALGVTPGYMMDIFAELVNPETNPLLASDSFRIPENFTVEERLLLNDFISFINYKKLLEQNYRQQAAPFDRSTLPESYRNISKQIGRDLEEEAKKRKVDHNNEENEQEEEENPQ